MNEKELDKRIRELEIKMASHHQKVMVAGSDIKELKGSFTWLNRLIFGTILLQLIHFLFSKLLV
ncbi:hypothetical protein [Alkalihalobacillus pseudalcaliphilus]|uniref:hypothetical protein n=1 Tax=Alkalihalobacillus pseudalcaliphilus TaxID=79884 RepID=UPI00064D8822|nr:hypothetical protein [Alkalihalobacillus pseudalcaliphilus]KMK77715.1 hypothetical protein AB990_04465 [Alkalihalobacillus pseudalcaliphilus]